MRAVRMRWSCASSPYAANWPATDAVAGNGTWRSCGDLLPCPAAIPLPSRGSRRRRTRSQGSRRRCPRPFEGRLPLESRSPRYASPIRAAPMPGFRTLEEGRESPSGSRVGGRGAARHVRRAHRPPGESDRRRARSSSSRPSSAGVQNVLLRFDVVVERHRRCPEPIGDSPDREGADPPVSQHLARCRDDLGSRHGCCARVASAGPLAYTVPRTLWYGT